MKIRIRKIREKKKINLCKTLNSHSVSDSSLQDLSPESLFTPEKDMLRILLEVLQKYSCPRLKPFSLYR